MKLLKNQLGNDPISALGKWIMEARESGLGEETVFTLATVDDFGAPDARMVVIRTSDDRGLTFFADQRSPKGLQLSTNPKAALAAHWPELSRHVRIRGTVAILPPNECDDAFYGRPRRSQLGYWANEQSKTIKDRATLENQLEATMHRFDGQEVIPRPDHWVVYCLRPESIEFWQSGEHHLHDRIVFDLTGDGWDARRLQP